MANDLDKALKRASTQAHNILKKSTEEFRPDVDKSIHILNLSRDVILEQLLQRAAGQRGRNISYKFSDEDIQIAEELVTTFISSVKKAAIDTQTFFCVDLAGNNLKYTASSETTVEDGIVIIAKVPTVIPFNKAKSLIIAGEKSIVSEFNSRLSKRGEVYKIFDTGHLSGRSVAEEMQMEAAAKFAVPSTKRRGQSNTLFRPSISVLQEIDFGKKDKFYSLVEKTRNIRLTDRTFLLELQRVVSPELKKYIKIKTNTVVMGVEPQSWEYNNFMAALEKADKAAMATLFDDVKKLGADYWAKKPGSPSQVENILNLLIKEASKIKGKKTKKLKAQGLRGRKEPSSYSSKKPKNTKASRKLNPTISTADKLNLPNVSRRPGTSNTGEARNWLSLLPIINARLVPKVLANMKAPALVNRTGTFAESARVVNIEQTREGYPSFVFDYERDPYDVFDRTKGRAPWNTPQRDPRALVDKSVREVVREMAIDRFYTRRA